MTDWLGQHFCVAGIGIAGYAAADALMQLGADVTIIDAGDGDRQRERSTILGELGATVMLGYVGPVPADTQVLVVSPGL